MNNATTATARCIETSRFIEARRKMAMRDPHTKRFTVCAGGMPGTIKHATQPNCTVR